MVNIKAKQLIYKIIAVVILAVFITTTVIPPSYAQMLALPAPDQMVTLSPVFQPAIVKGIKIYRADPLRFDFIVTPGNESLHMDARSEEITKLIKYFLASLTVPEKDLWVNLSPYEKNRIIPKGFGKTEMGRDLLVQDYLLKQITSSLMYPENDLGKEFWDNVYKEAFEKFGTSDIPVDTFNKVWIVPEKAVVYENGDSAFVVEGKLKVMLEADYLAQKTAEEVKDSKSIAAKSSLGRRTSATSTIASDIIKQIIIPALEHEVNTGKNFAPLRQIYNSLILATWFKRKLHKSSEKQNHVETQNFASIQSLYIDKNKTAGVNVNDMTYKKKIYGRYLEAFRKGAYNYIKEDYDPVKKEIVPHKYFSGGLGLQFDQGKQNFIETFDKTIGSKVALNGAMTVQVQLNKMDNAMKTEDAAGININSLEVQSGVSTKKEVKDITWEELVKEEGYRVNTDGSNSRKIIARVFNKDGEILKGKVVGKTGMHESEVVMRIFAGPKIIILDSYWPHFPEPKEEEEKNGKGRALLRYLLKDERYEGFTIFSLGSGDAQKSFKKMLDFQAKVVSDPDFQEVKDKILSNLRKRSHLNFELLDAIRMATIIAFVPKNDKAMIVDRNLRNVDKAMAQGKSTATREHMTSLLDKYLRICEKKLFMSDTRLSDKREFRKEFNIQLLMAVLPFVNWEQESASKLLKMKGIRIHRILEGQKNVIQGQMSKFKERKRDAERDIIVRALEITNGDRSAAVKYLGVSYTFISYVLEKYGLDAQSFKKSSAEEEQANLREKLLKKKKKSFSRDQISVALKAKNGNMSQAGKLLGVSRERVRQYVREYKIDINVFISEGKEKADYSDEIEPMSEQMRGFYLKELEDSFELFKMNFGSDFSDKFKTLKESGTAPKEIIRKMIPQILGSFIQYKVDHAIKIKPVITGTVPNLEGIKKLGTVPDLIGMVHGARGKDQETRLLSPVADKAMTTEDGLDANLGASSQQAELVKSMLYYWYSAYDDKKQGEVIDLLEKSGLKDNSRILEVGPSGRLEFGLTALMLHKKTVVDFLESPYSAAAADFISGLQILKNAIGNFTKEISDIPGARQYIENRYNVLDFTRSKSEKIMQEHAPYDIVTLFNVIDQETNDSENIVQSVFDKVKAGSVIAVSYRPGTPVRRFESMLMDYAKRKFFTLSRIYYESNNPVAGDSHDTVLYKLEPLKKDAAMSGEQKSGITDVGLDVNSGVNTPQAELVKQLLDIWYYGNNEDMQEDIQFLEELWLKEDSKILQVGHSQSRETNFAVSALILNKNAHVDFLESSSSMAIPGLISWFDLLKTSIMEPFEKDISHIAGAAEYIKNRYTIFDPASSKSKEIMQENGPYDLVTLFDQGVDDRVKIIQNVFEHVKVGSVIAASSLSIESTGYSRNILNEIAEKHGFSLHEIPVSDNNLGSYSNEIILYKIEALEEEVKAVPSTAEQFLNISEKKKRDVESVNITNYKNFVETVDEIFIQKIKRRNNSLGNIWSKKLTRQVNPEFLPQFIYAFIIWKIRNGIVNGDKRNPSPDGATDAVAYSYRKLEFNDNYEVVDLDKVLSKDISAVKKLGVKVPKTVKQYIAEFEELLNRNPDKEMIFGWIRSEPVGPVSDKAMGVDQGKIKKTVSLNQDFDADEQERKVFSFIYWVIVNGGSDDADVPFTEKDFREGREYFDKNYSIKDLWGTMSRLIKFAREFKGVDPEKLKTADEYVDWFKRLLPYENYGKNHQGHEGARSGDSGIKTSFDNSMASELPDRNSTNAWASMVLYSQLIEKFRNFSDKRLIRSHDPVFEVLSHLLPNAFDELYFKSRETEDLAYDPRINIKVILTKESTFRLIVEDNGRGISQKRMKKIFEKDIDPEENPKRLEGNNVNGKEGIALHRIFNLDAKSVKGFPLEYKMLIKKVTIETLDESGNSIKKIYFPKERHIEYTDKFVKKERGTRVTVDLLPRAGRLDPTTPVFDNKEDIVFLDVSWPPQKKSSREEHGARSTEEPKQDKAMSSSVEHRAGSMEREMRVMDHKLGFLSRELDETPDNQSPLTDHASQVTNLDSQPARRDNAMMINEQKEMMSKLIASMPQRNDPNPDWEKFKDCYRKLKESGDGNLKIDLFDTKGYEALKSLHPQRLTKSVFFDQDGSTKTPKFLVDDENFKYLGSDEKWFLYATVQNVVQHVMGGIAVVIQENRGKYLKISVIDNGNGFADKAGSKVSIRDAIKWKRSYGEEGQNGLGLSVVASIFPRFAIIDTPDDWMFTKKAIKIPYVNIPIPSIVKKGFHLKRLSGTRIVGYFFNEKVNRSLYREVNRVINKDKQMFSLKRTEAALEMILKEKLREPYGSFANPENNENQFDQAMGTKDSDRRLVNSEQKKLGQDAAMGTGVRKGGININIDVDVNVSLNDTNRPKDKLKVFRDINAKQIRSNRRKVAQLLTYPSDFNWERNANQIPDVNGLYLGKTNVSGKIILIINSKFHYYWPVLGFNEKNWDVYISKGNVTKWGYELNVKLVKDNEKVIQRKFQIGSFQIGVTGQYKSSDQKKMILKISARLGQDAVGAFMLKPENISWEKYLQQMPNLKGLHIGTTNSNGEININIKKGCNFRWCILGFKQKQWDAVIESVEVKGNFSELTVRLSKKGKRDILKTFQVGPFYCEINKDPRMLKKQKGEVETIQVLEINDRMGINGIKHIIKKPLDISWQKYVEHMPDLNGLVLGVTNSLGAISFSVDKYYQFIWFVLGFEEKGWKAVLHKGKARMNCFEITVQMTKEGRKDIFRTFQIGPFYRTLKQHSKDGKKQNKKRGAIKVLEINDKMGLQAIKNIISKPSSVSLPQYISTMPELGGLFLGQTNGRGVLTFPIDYYYRHSWSVLGFPEGGWKAKILTDEIVDGMYHFIVELSKDDNKVYRHFVISRFKKVVRGIRVEKDKHREFLRIFNVNHLKRLINAEGITRQVIRSRAQGLIDVKDFDSSPLKLFLKKEFFTKVKKVLENFKGLQFEIAQRFIDGEEETDLIDSGFTVKDVREVRSVFQRELKDYRDLTVIGEGNKDTAMITNQPSKKGGIDLDPSRFDIETKGKGTDFVMPADFGNIENFTGFTPVIIRIIPITNAPFLLGLVDEESEGTKTSGLSAADRLRLVVADKRG